MQRKTFDAPVRRVESIIVEGKRSQGRPRRTWGEQIRVDLHELNLSADLTRDRSNSLVEKIIFAACHLLRFSLDAALNSEKKRKKKLF